ncbi:MAG: hypothetical protein EBY35_04905 [Rhodobacteraceae bacterium]|nr:hypothetical protein [Paracoccaceae bacterium]
MHHRLRQKGCKAISSKTPSKLSGTPWPIQTAGVRITILSVRTGCFWRLSAFDRIWFVQKFTAGSVFLSLVRFSHHAATIWSWKTDCVIRNNF